MAGSAGSEDSDGAAVCSGELATVAVTIAGEVAAEFVPAELLPAELVPAKLLPAELVPTGFVPAEELLPLRAALMASMRALLRMPPAPLMPTLPASCLSSGSSIELRPPDFARLVVSAGASATAAGVASEVSVT